MVLWWKVIILKWVAMEGVIKKVKFEQDSKDMRN